MMMILMWLGCSEQNKTYFYDISSTVLVTDEHGMMLDLEEVEFCQRFRSEDYNTQTSWTVSSDLCEVVDVKDGVAQLSNWEGEYFGPDVTMVIELISEGELFEAELLDNDTEVWCDNEIITEVNEHSVSTDGLCAENFERYLLWSLELPSKRDLPAEE